ncbi:hypothetical protein KUV85_11200 [Nocardioides panacisoli]|uniref:hypothetical protein n=1 Tax=Nocardioides panacisoli TaxID=627624 RepID=UPI001C634F35|nr:hypothetical protein [Nocardioides panacisoli]QYJ02901.1 hypothetical protein KUV85_11200 [Nocardioides panacisoli]
MRRPLVLAILTALLGATLAMAAPTSSSALDTASATAPAVDTSPPAVGSCHNLTSKEARRRADGKPAVDCDSRHTTLTIKIARFSNPDWSLGPKMNRKISKKCMRGLVKYFDGRTKRIQLSGYMVYNFIPKWRQRNAGANWVRCDIALPRPRWMPPLPGNGNPPLGRPPLADNIARCLKSIKGTYYYTTCNAGHQVKATRVIKTRYDRYPGRKNIERDAERRCGNRLGRKLAVYEFPPRTWWKAGLTHFVCYERD